MLFLLFHFPGCKGTHFLAGQGRKQYKVISKLSTANVYNVSLQKQKSTIHFTTTETDMFTVIGIMLAGIGIGFLLRKHRFSGINHIITILIWLLLFLLGTEVGSNRRIVEGIASLGIEALLITLACVVGSCIFAWALWKILQKGKEGKA